ncbi:hypothetical protein BGZ63DRAFT_216342 [Mariannaea sp. PMI_226]|nr:hypothetical protein BGZ63DRAFT_216342 [Mariannaea sp. PMI_226]
MNDVEEPSSQSYCIAQGRCRLCQFGFTRGEPVLAALPDGRISREFTFRKHMSFDDTDMGVVFHMCLENTCMFSDYQAVSFHSRCYKLHLHPITPAFLAITNYTYTPPVCEQRRRANYISPALASNLRNAAVWPSALPSELWIMIAQYLVRECATLTTQELVQNGETVEDYIINLTQPVFASYLKIEGRCYIQSLSNTPRSNACEGSHLVVPAQTRQEERKDIFIAVDHLGVRQVVFIPHDRVEQWCRSRPSVSGAWWKHISGKDVPSTITIKSDGLKMRDILSTQNEPLHNESRIGWQIPLPSPPASIDLFTLRRPRKNISGLRMRYFDCNTPNIVGYSVATDGWDILSILSHEKGQKNDSSLYEDVTASICHWMYMPINEGEYLTEICRQTSNFLEGEVAGITVSNKV